MGAGWAPLVIGGLDTKIIVVAFSKKWRLYGAKISERVKAMVRVGSGDLGRSWVFKSSLRKVILGKEVNRTG